MKTHRTAHISERTETEVQLASLHLILPVFKCFDFVTLESDLQAAYYLRASLVFLTAGIPLQ